MSKPARNIYPDISGIDFLPIFLAGVGGTEHQTKVVREQGHEWHQIIRCGEGTGMFVADGQETLLHENDFILIPLGYPYEYYPVSEQWSTNWIVFGGSASGELLKNLELDKPLVLTISDNSVPRGLFTDIYVSVSSDQVFGHQIASGYVYDLILWFKQTRILAEMNKLRKNSRQILTAATRYIEENAARDITLKEISDFVGISQQHMCRIFREYLSMHSSEYITRVRLNLAMEKLLNSDIPMAEIASSCGFRSASYFSTVFGKYEHMTPNNYRKKYRV